MRWGKRNGPPYPLSASDHSASERKAGWRKSLDKSSRDSHTKDVSGNDKEKHGLTDKQKKAIKIGAAVAVTALAAYGTYRLAKSGKLDKYIEIVKKKVDVMLSDKKVGSAKDFTNSESAKLGKQAVDSILGQSQKAKQVAGGLKRLAKAESLSETLKNVNPNRGNPDYNNNCTLCSIASFFRQQGLDVKAGKTGGEGQILGGIVEECFKGAKVLDGSAVKFGRSRQDAAEMLLKRFGNNAEGVCGVQWKNGGGHAFNWKIKDGIVSFFDGQSGKTDVYCSNVYWRLINSNGHLTIARLDNAEINYDGVKKLLE